MFQIVSTGLISNIVLHLTQSARTSKQSLYLLANAHTVLRHIHTDITFEKKKYRLVGWVIQRKVRDIFCSRLIWFQVGKYVRRVRNGLGCPPRWYNHVLKTNSKEPQYGQYPREQISTCGPLIDVHQRHTSELTKTANIQVSQHSLFHVVHVICIENNGQCIP